MILPVLQYPDPRLSDVSAPVDEITDAIKTLAADMLETMYANEGIGLAAPQVGHFLRLVVIDLAGPDDEKRPLVLVNPELELLGESLSSEEGCLSVPYEYRACVPRRAKVRFTDLDLEGTKLEFEAEDLLAICLQHEVDHLDGKLFIDYLSRLKRTLYNASLKRKAK